MFTIEQLNIRKKNFIWQRKNKRIKYSTLCNSYKNGGLKDVDLFHKIISFWCSWLRRLFDGDNFHEWKVIPLHLIKKKFGENFKFHSNVAITKCSLNNLPHFYKYIFTQWRKYLSFSVSFPSAITSQFLWFNKYIKVDREETFSNLAEQLFDLEWKLKNWTTVKKEYHLLESQSMQWMQLVNALDTPWPQSMRE